MTTNASRRLFLRQAGAFSAVAAGAAPLALNLAALGSAAAQSAADYKALVCLFFFGGNDAYNMVLPTDSASWTHYQAVRQQAPDPIALPAVGTAPDLGAANGTLARLGGVLPIAPANAQGRSFALHPAMGTLQTMFDTDQRLAVLANVGPLVMPTTKAQYALATHPRPANLFSHNDQQNTWQALAPEGVTTGWGGRMADVLAAGNARSIFTAISASGNAVWLSGRSVRQYQVGGNGAIRLGSDGNGKVYGSTEVAAAMQRIATATRGTHVIEGDIAAVAQRSIDAEAALRSAMRPASDPLFGTAPGSGAYSASADPKLQYDSVLSGAKAFNALAQQFQVVARMIHAGTSGGLGARRQVFFVSVGGFDTHDAQVRNQAELMARVSHALRYFDTTLGGLGLRDQVTVFTASDFGRTFTSNGDGTDHGWGSHHLIAGGAVRGGDLYGTFPVLAAKNAANNQFDGSPDQLANGALLPTVSVDQYAATLGRWFGVDDAQLADIFPHLANFDPGVRNLGFMR